MPEQSPRRAAMDLLARREHSRRELQLKLTKRFDERQVIEALDRLRDEGLQSDERFAASFTRERLLRAYGPLRVRAELRQRGVDETVIDEVLARIPAEEGRSWSDAARDALRRRFGESPAVDIKERARRARYLYQRGFDRGEHVPDS
ncbi:MAG: regulatory protein RecX [Halieaceae bacterium]|jgi:regulatory protein|nr:regulatory protein RecX [Halieaceae bacterium]